METKTKTLIDLINEILDQTQLTNPHDIALMLLERMDVDSQLSAFALILPAYVSSKMSYMAPPSSAVNHSNNPSPTTTKHGSSPQKAGVPWFKQSSEWDKRRLSSGIAGQWVFWEDFTTEMCSLKIEELNKRISTMDNSIEKYALIRSTLRAHKVEKVGDLPTDVKSDLEKALGAIPAE